jgi:radical SAM protein with 4Fe4S-binding SPASM domain
MKMKDIQKLEVMVEGTFPHLRAPEIVCWDITLLCNQGCLSCYNFARENDAITIEESKARLEKIRKHSRAHEPDAAQAREILDALAQGNIFEIDFMGGEPMSYRHIGEMVDEAHKRRIVSNFITNGTYVKEFLEQIDKVRGRESREEYLKKRVNHVGFSFHGPTAELHEGFTRIKGSFQEAIAGMKILNALGVNVGLLLSPTTDTKDKLYDTVARLVQKEGISLHTAYINRLVNVGGCKQNQDKVINECNFLDMLEQLVRIRRDFGITAKTTDAIPYCRLLAHLKRKYKSQLREMNVEERRTLVLPYLQAVGACYFGTNNLAISKDGLAKICTIPPDRFNMGDIRKEGVETIWKTLAEYREPKKWAKECISEKGLCNFYEQCRAACKITHTVDDNEQGERIYSHDIIMVGVRGAERLRDYFGLEDVTAAAEEKLDDEIEVEERTTPSFVKGVLIREEEQGYLLYERSRELFRSGTKFMLNERGKRFVEEIDGIKTLGEIAPLVGGMNVAKEMYLTLYKGGVVREKK